MKNRGFPPFLQGLLGNLGVDPDHPTKLYAGLLRPTGILRGLERAVQVLELHRAVLVEQALQRLRRLELLHTCPVAWPISKNTLEHPSALEVFTLLST